MRNTLFLMMLTALLSIGVCLSCTGKKHAPSEFSADLISMTPHGELRGKIYVKGGMSRMEFPGSVVIARQDRGTVWVMVPAQKAYLEHDMRPEYVFSVGGRFPGEISRELVARENVDGCETEKYRIVYMLGDSRHDVFQWVCRRTGMPIKTADVKGHWMYRFANFNEGSQSSALFELADGYNKFEIPGNSGIPDVTIPTDVEGVQ